MFSASLYIIVCSVRNRFRVRLRRLREPRYLVGALAAAAYLWITFFARSRGARVDVQGRRERTPPPVEVVTALQVFGQAFIALSLLVLAGVGWILPFDSGLLEFSRAEQQFLFTAPVSRRQLLLHRLMRSQLGLLFASAIAAAMYPSGSIAARVRWSMAIWVLLVTAKVYFTGVTLARTRIGSRDGSARRVALAPVAFIAAALVVVGNAIAHAAAERPPGGLGDVFTLVADVSSSGLPRIVLWPFTALARPIWAPTAAAYLAALPAALAVLAATVAWVLGSDRAFQEAAAAVAERRARRKAGRTPTITPRAAAWTLALSGRVEAVFLWKGAMQTFRVVDRVAVARFAAAVFGLALAAVSLSRARSVAAMLGLFATIGAGAAVVLGPQILRLDLRQDLVHLELLKTWPVRSSALVRGEMLWPASVLTVLAWALTGLALLLSTTVFPQVSVLLRVGMAGAAVLLAPVLVLAQFTIHNGLALLFPAWVPLGSQRARGLDVMGQRLVLLGGVWLALLVAVAPGAMVGGVVWLAFRLVIGPAALIPAAAACAVIMAIEVLLASEALGPVYEKLDLSAIEKGE